MTDNNLFDEVRADLERQRLQALWNAYGIWLAVAVLGIVIATAATTGYKSWQAQREQQTTEALLTAAQSQKDPAKTLEMLQTFAATHAGNAESELALLHAGALAADGNDKAKAIEIFDKVAADDKADPVFRQLGVLLSVQMQMDSGDAKSLMARLQPVADGHAPWRYSALEAQGYLALRLGDKDRAKRIFTDLSQDAGTPASIAARATDMARSLN